MDQLTMMLGGRNYGLIFPATIKEEPDSYSREADTFVKMYIFLK